MNNKWVIFLGGVLLGILLILGWNSFNEPKQVSTVYEVKKEIHLKNGVIIPKGINFIKKASMPEGYDIIILNIAMMRGYLREYFIEKKNEQGTTVYYWADKDQISQ